MTIRFSGNPKKAKSFLDQRRIAAGEAFTRSTAFDGSALDDKSFTVSAVIATSHPVSRLDGKGKYAEILDPFGLEFAEDDDFPLQLDHSPKARETIGRAFALVVEDDAVKASLRFTSADDAKPIRDRVRDGSLRHVSAGYRVLRWREGFDAQGNRTKTAIKWRLHEVSVTPIAADPNAIIKRSTQMENEEITELTPAQHRAEIRSIGRAANMTAEAIDDMIDREIDATAARAEAFEAMRERQRSTPRIRVVANHDDPAASRARLVNGLAQRMGATIEGDVQHRSFKDLARDAAAATGFNVRTASDDEIMVRAMTSSDFPIVVGDAVSKTLNEMYRQSESAIKPLSRQRTLPNFKESVALRLTGAGKLLPLSESGEIVATGRGESAEKLSVATYAARLDLTRKVMIDDDAGAFGDTVAALGRAAAATESELLSGLVTGNPLMSDGTGVFRTANTTTAGALSETTLSAMRLAMRQRRDSDGTLIAIKPVTLLVGSEIETAAEKLLTQIQAAMTDDVNPWSKLRLVVDPYIEDGRFILFGDIPALAHAYLSGHVGPTVQRQEMWDSLAVSWRVYEDFGCAWTDWRAVQFNAGV